MNLTDDITSPEFLPEETAPIASRLRFEDPQTFLDFYDRQLCQMVVGLRHPKSISVGTRLLLIVSPPGVPDRLKLAGVATRVIPRDDGTVRLRVEVDPDVDDIQWMDAYVTGLRSALNWIDHHDLDTMSGIPSLPQVDPPPPKVREKEVLDLASRIDTMTYYQLLDVPRDIQIPSLQTHFHDLTRRFHPDLFHNDPDRILLDAANRVYRRMNEAYAVLRNPAQRRTYDTGLMGDPHTWSLRLSDEAQERAQRRQMGDRGVTKAGEFYWAHARSLLKTTEMLTEAIRVLRIAITFEPDNNKLRETLSDAQQQLKRSTPG